MAKQKRQFKKIVNWECEEPAKQFIVADIIIIVIAFILLFKYDISVWLFASIILLPFIGAWISAHKREVTYEEL